MKKLRVLLVDDEIMIREGFKRLFDWEAHDCEVVGEAADGMEALAAAEERPIAAMTRYMQTHLAEEISLNLLAEAFHLSPQYISQLFKSEIGVNFLTYLTNLRMERAKKLLLSTALAACLLTEADRLLLPAALIAAVAANLIDRYDEKQNQRGDAHE